MQRDECWLNSFIARICGRIERYSGKAPNYVEVKALIERFVRNNPDADVEAVDWVAYFDPRLEYTEILERFRQAYPQYRWEDEEARQREHDEEQYFSELLNYLISQARELPPELRLQLVREVSGELGLPLMNVKALEEEVIGAVKPAERPRPERTRVVVVDLELLAKYPLLDEAKSMASAFSFNEIGGEVYGRAAERVVEAVERGIVSAKLGDPLTEVLSFPVAMAMTAYLANDWLRRRLAYAEGKRIERSLTVEESDVLEFVARRFFKTVKPVESDDYADKRNYGDYEMSFEEFIKATTDSGLSREGYWKLVNRVVHKGYVYLSAADLARLVRAKAQTTVLNKLLEINPKSVPESVRRVVEEIKPRIGEALSRTRNELAAIPDDVPPCMKAIEARILAGEDVSHFENFALATYLLSAGRSVEEVLELFKHRSDYNERIARYQVEHIAGLRGGRTRYRPPSCEKLRTLGICVEAGKHCGRISNPLQYRPSRKISNPSYIA